MFDNSLFTNIQVILKLDIVHEFCLFMAMGVLVNSHQGTSTSGILCVLVLALEQRCVALVKVETYIIRFFVGLFFREAFFWSMEW